VALILAVALVYTFARGTWLSLVIALVVVGVSVDRRSVAISAGIGVAALAIALVLPRGILLEPGSQWSMDLQNALLGRLGAIGEGRDLRFKFIENAIPIVEDHPLVGSGPGTYGGGVAAHFGSPDYNTYTDGVVPTGRTVDNYWLHILVEFGLLGAALLVGMLACRARLLRAARRAPGASGSSAAVAASAIVISLDSGTEMLPRATRRRSSSGSSSASVRSSPRRSSRASLATPPEPSCRRRRASPRPSPAGAPRPRATRAGCPARLVAATSCRASAHGRPATTAIPRPPPVDDAVQEPLVMTSPVPTRSR
jgi:hypothetical protein